MGKRDDLLYYQVHYPDRTDGRPKVERVDAHVDVEDLKKSVLVNVLKRSNKYGKRVEIVEIVKEIVAVYEVYREKSDA